MKKITSIIFLMIFSLGYSKSTSLPVVPCTSEMLSCTEIYTDAQQGSFTDGYKVTFETVGTSVIATFELLDTNRAGVIAFLWQKTPFGETPMDKTSGLIFTKTLEDQTIGTTISYACKFAFAGGLAVTKYIDYVVGDNCNGGGGDDTEAPTDFSVSIGIISSTSIELLLEGKDNSGAIVYDVTFGTTTKSTTGISGTKKSLIINNLTPETEYIFSVKASDSKGNMALNNPIEINATTIADTNTECSGVSSEAQQGSFSLGYNYAFQTDGTDVTVTFEMLDTNKAGVIAYLWQSDPFSETPMDKISGLTFSKTISGQTPDATVNFACKFAYAGGLVVTKYFTYTVGKDCQLGIKDNEFNKSIKLYPNPAKGILNIDSKFSPISKIEFYSVLGSKIMETTKNYDVIHIEDLSRGVYLVKVYMKNNKFAIKKLIVE